LKNILQFRKLILHQIEKSDLRDWRRIDGIKGEEALKDSNVLKLLAPGVEKTANSKLRSAHSDHSIGSIGCYLAHMTAWQKFLNESDKQYLMILEDDVSIPKNIQEKVQNVLNVSKDLEWDMMNLGNRNCWTPTTPIKKFETFEIVKMHIFTGMGGYLLKRSSIPKILKLAVPIQYQLDWFFSYHEDKIKNLAVYPFVVNLTIEANNSYIKHTPVSAVVDENVVPIVVGTTVGVIVLISGIIVGVVLLHKVKNKKKSI
jgi:GR25 family glycosyltransferase involved in LPS biosynthesis